jgi:hypothetical protein
LNRLFLLVLTFLVLPFITFAQSVSTNADAAKTIQPSQSSADETPAQAGSEVKVPAGTPIEVEVAFTVRSLDVRPGEHISFRVLVPVMVDGVTVIPEGALVTARITESKRGGHWGKAGKLAWNMEDVVAADNSRIALRPETNTRNGKLWSLETNARNLTTPGQGRITGTSHVGEVATMSIASGVLFPPLALMGVFKRGEDAVLREGRRFVALVGKDSVVRVKKQD